jgi:hypothetical protein
MSEDPTPHEYLQRLGETAETSVDIAESALMFAALDHPERTPTSRSVRATAPPWRATRKVWDEASRKSSVAISAMKAIVCIMTIR